MPGDTACRKTYLPAAMTTRFPLLFRFAAAALLAGLTACSQDYSPNTYSGDAVQQAAKVEQGIVVGVRKIDVSAQTAVGAATGAAAGGITGSQAPGGGVTAALGAVGGGLIGGLIGSTAEHTGADTTAYEYVVREPKGDLVSVTQQDPVPLQIGTHVLVIAGKQARIVRDYTVNIETPPTAPAAKDTMPITLPPPLTLAVPAPAPTIAPEP
jgi:outer membrane lipoprotein SlyB